MRPKNEAEGEGKTLEGGSAVEGVLSRGDVKCQSRLW
jgi:hypothetical protein